MRTSKSESSIRFLPRHDRTVRDHMYNLFSCLTRAKLISADTHRAKSSILLHKIRSGHGLQEALQNVQNVRSFDLQSAICESRDHKADMEAALRKSSAVPVLRTMRASHRASLSGSASNAGRNVVANSVQFGMQVRFKADDGGYLHVHELGMSKIPDVTQATVFTVLPAQITSQRTYEALSYRVEGAKVAIRLAKVKSDASQILPRDNAKTVEEWIVQGCEDAQKPKFLASGDIVSISSVTDMALHYETKVSSAIVKAAQDVWLSSIAETKKERSCSSACSQWILELVLCNKDEPRTNTTNKGRRTERQKQPSPSQTPNLGQIEKQSYNLDSSDARDLGSDEMDTMIQTHRSSESFLKHYRPELYSLRNQKSRFVQLKHVSHCNLKTCYTNAKFT